MKNIKFERKNIEEVRILKIYFNYEYYKVIFEIRKFRKNLYKIESYGADKKIAELFVPFSIVKEFFKEIKKEKINFIS